MSWKTILWPWGALDEYERTIGAQRAQIERQANSVRLLQEEREDVLHERNEARLRLINAEIEISRLRRIVGRGHFRNPVTGRVGKVGETFPGLDKV